MTTRVPGAITVVSVPAEHPYVVRSIATPGRVDDGLSVPTDVIPEDRPAGQWWPPLALDPGVLGRWLAGDGLGASRPAIDLLHVQFGFEGVPLAHLEACVALLRDHGVPLVVTVHDLRNPHLQADRDYAPRLGLLVQSADALVTLTDAAADEIRRRWHRDAIVIPHPHVAPLERIGAAGPGWRPGGAPRVRLALKSLRANTLTAAQVEQAAAAVTGAGADLHISIHREAMQPDFPRHDPEMAAVLRRLSRDGGSNGRVTLTEHQRLDDDAFLDDLARHDAVLLPYRFGTHSGVLEACRDMHTVALVPDVGCYASQAACITYAPDDIAGTLPGAVAAARALWAEDGHHTPADHDTGRLAAGWFVDRVGRSEQAAQVRAAHRRVYAAVLEGRARR